MKKNVNAIDKIIAAESMKCYLQANPKGKYKKPHPYTLNDVVMEALEIKKAYLKDEITEADYKAWCLKYNLITE